MSSLTVLRRYAQANPATLPASVLLTHTEATSTIFDAYPKSIFHFLTLPRPNAAPASNLNLANLKTLLRSDKARAKELLLALRKDASDVEGMIRQEMDQRFGYRWTIWTGFHAVPSMEHLHVHVMSSDLCGTAMKTKKHYNSFHPKLGFFLHLDHVLEWFDAEPSYFSTMSKLNPSQYEPLLKEPLTCWRCGTTVKSMPTLKEHLQKDRETESAKEKAKFERKRKLEEREANMTIQKPNKKHEVDASNESIPAGQNDKDIERDHSPSTSHAPDTEVKS